MKSSTAEYWLLKEISNLDAFGQEMFHSKFGYNGVSMIDRGGASRHHGLSQPRRGDAKVRKAITVEAVDEGVACIRISVLQIFFAASFETWRPFIKPEKR